MKKLISILKNISGYAEDSSSPAPQPAASNRPPRGDHPEKQPSKPKTHGGTGNFEDLKLIPEIRRALAEEGYTSPTPIQTKAIPFVLEGRDLLGCAQTGTGKTAAFALPLLQRLLYEGRGLRTLVLTPTRELALQVADSFKTYGRYTDIQTVVAFGGVGIEPQKRALAGRPDVLVATPGRLLDLLGQRALSLNTIQMLVLDEADRMLDMGFIHDVKRIISQVPKKRQTLLFSATMPKDIQELSMNVLINPAQVEVAPVATTSEQVTQSLYYVNRNDKRPLLLHLLEDPSMTRVLVFTRTKAIANRVSDLLKKNKITAEAIHGNKSQSARQRALESFRRGDTRVLVASDLAARGLDIDEVSHVINFDLPNVPETYVHRIGRTGRADHRGLALSFCDAEERPFLKDIEKLTRQSIPVVTEHPFAPKGGLPTASEPSQSSDGHQRHQRPRHRQGRHEGRHEGRQNGQGQRRPNQDSRQQNRSRPHQPGPRPQNAQYSQDRQDAGSGQQEGANQPQRRRRRRKRPGHSGGGGGGGSPQ